MASKKLEIRLSLKDGDTVKEALRAIGAQGEKALNRIEASAKPASAKLKMINAASIELQGSLRNLSSHAGSLGSILSSISPVGLAAAASLGALAYGAVSLSKNMLTAGDNIQGLKLKLAAMIGSTEAASAAFTYLQRQSQAQGASFDALSDGFSKLYPAVNANVLSLGKLKELLNGFNNTTKVLEIGVNEAKLSLIGLSQLLTAGTGNMVDLKQATAQLPGVLDKLASSMGYTSGQLRENISKIAAKELVEPFIKTFNDVGKNASFMGDTVSSSMTKLKDTTSLAFAKMAEDSGLLKFVTENINGLNKAIINTFGLVERMDKKGLGEFATKLEKDLGKYSGFKPIEELIKGKIKKLEIAEGKANPSAANEVAKEGNLLLNQRLGLLKGITEEAGRQYSYSKLGNKERYIAQKLDYAKEEMRKKGLELSKAEEASLKKTYALTYDNNNKQKSTLHEYIKGLKEQDALLRMAPKERAVMVEVLKAEAAALKDGISLSKSQREEVKKMASDMQNFAEAEKRLDKERKEQIRKIEEARREFERPFVQAAENIQSAFADSFTSILENGKLRAKDLAKSIKSIMFRTIGEITAAMVFKPLIQPVVASAMGMFGMQNMANAAGMQNIGSFNPVSAYGLFNGTAGGFGLINQFGANYLGTGLPGMAGSLTSTSLSSVLGAAGIGAFGGGLMAKLTGGNSLGGSVGGGIGGAIGSAIMPGIGTLIGSALGGLAGSLFGGKKGKPISRFFGTLSPDGSFADIGYGSKRATTEYARELAKNFSDYAKQVSSITNTKLAKRAIFGGATRLGENNIGIDGTHGHHFNPKDSQSVQTAFSKLSVELLKVSDITNNNLNIALKHLQVDGKKAEEVLSDLQFATNFHKLAEKAKPITEAEQALANLNTEFEKTRVTASRLGLSIEEVNKAQQAQVDILKEEFTKNVSDELLSVIDPLSLSIQQEQKRYEEQLKNAKVLYADVAKVEALHQAKLMEIRKNYGLIIEDEYSSSLLMMDNEKRQISLLKEQIELAKTLASRFEGASKSIKQFMDNLLISDYSYLTPKEKYIEARSRFGADSNLAKSGNIEAIERIAQTAKEFLDSSRMYNASGKEYIGDFNQVSSDMNQLRGIAESHRNAQKAMQEGFFAQVRMINEQIMQNRMSSQNMQNIRIPGFASGGITPENRMFMVGERGPELMYTGKKSTVFSAGETKKMLEKEDTSKIAGKFDELIMEFKLYRMQSARENLGLKEAIEEIRKGIELMQLKLSRLLAK